VRKRKKRSRENRGSKKEGKTMKKGERIRVERK
jgi:hypothetical protein